MDANDLCLLSLARKQLADGTAMRLRENAGIKRVEMAAAAGVSVPALARWEHGSQIPRGKPALRYAHALAELTEMITASAPEGGATDAA